MPDISVPLRADEIENARRRIAGAAIRTPLATAADGRTRLKLECLQPYGSFKIRGATNAVRAWIERGEAAGQVVSASAGNFGQAIAAAARAAGLPAVVHVPEGAARTKLERLTALGASVRPHPFEDWWAILQTRRTDDAGTFFHPVCEREVIAGAATIGAELLEDAPELEAVFVPIGGGGLASGIAQGVKRLKPSCRIVAVETEASTPLTAARRAGRPVPVERRASFIDGMGGSGVLEEMWPLLQRLIDDVVVVSVAEVEDAIRTLALHNRVIAEGAGAAAPAAAARFGGPNAAAIVSGGNLDASELMRILATS